MAKLFTMTQRNKLIANHEINAQLKGKTLDHRPVIKLFTPWGGGTWLLTEFDVSNGVFFGLCDTGRGTPELGRVDIAELEALRGPGGLKVERDRHWRPTRKLSEYVEEATRRGRITS